MGCWLYQMRANDDEPYRPEHYRREVCEGKTVSWPSKEPISIDLREQEEPTAGDTIIFFFCKSGLRGDEEPGIYGLGEIKEFVNDAESGRILEFRVEAPNDRLKMEPLCGPGIERLVNGIRGGWKQRTMWAITAAEFARLRKCMRVYE